MALLSSTLVFCWELTKRHPGLVMVLFGVVGEVICDWKDMSGRLARAKRFSAIQLILGLGIEFIEAAKSDKDVSSAIERAGVAEKEAGQANERASNTESNNFVLQAKVLTLQAKLQPRTISDENFNKFINMLNGSPKGKVRIIYASLSNEVRRYIDRIRGMLDLASYGVGDNTSVEFKPEVSVNDDYGSRIIILVNNPENAPPYFAPIQQAFTRIGIPTFGVITSYTNSTYKVPAGEIEVFITERP